MRTKVMTIWVIMTVLSCATGVSQAGVIVFGDKDGMGMFSYPIDPTTGTSDWGLRSYQDSPDSTTWGRQNVYDVYTRSRGTGLDGTSYTDW